MAKGSRKNRKGTRRTDLVVTPLKQHKKIGKDVLPPFAQLQRDMAPKMVAASWLDHRLPEMLWASMAIAVYGREDALSRFRTLARFVADSVEVDPDRAPFLANVTLTGLAAWSDSEFKEFEDIVVADSRASFAVLGVFEQLPGRGRWLGIAPPKGKPFFDVLKAGVGLTLWHQSQEATDCRWLKVLAAMMAGTFNIPDGT